MKQRQKVIPRARGRVLEIGVGSGLNLSLYNAEKVDELIGLDPSPEMIKIAKGEIGCRKPNGIFLKIQSYEMLPIRFNLDLSFNLAGLEFWQFSRKRVKG